MLAVPARWDPLTLLAQLGTDGSQPSAALDRPELRARVIGLGIDLDPQGEAGFASFLSAQIATWGRVVREANIRPD